MLKMTHVHAQWLMHLVTWTYLLDFSTIKILPYAAVMFFIYNAASLVKPMHAYVIGYLFNLWEMQKRSTCDDY